MSLRLAFILISLMVGMVALAFGAGAVLELSAGVGNTAMTIGGSLVALATTGILVMVIPGKSRELRTLEALIEWVVPLVSKDEGAIVSVEEKLAGTARHKDYLDLARSRSPVFDRYRAKIEVHREIPNKRMYWYQFDLALSFASEDAEHAQEIRWAFVVAGFNVNRIFMYDSDENLTTTAGRKIDRVNDVIFGNSARFAISIVTANWVASDECKLEAAALRRRIDEADRADDQRAVVIPVHIDVKDLKHCQNSFPRLSSVHVQKVSSLAAKLKSELPPGG